MSVKILQLHKRDVYKYKFIQDKYAVNSTNTVFAIADGTTQSFKSEFWAETLVSEFASNPTFHVNQLIQTFTVLAQQFRKADFVYNKNPAIAAIEKGRYKKGGTSTFIGVEIINNQTLKFIGCGDSNAFIFRNNDFDSFPFLDVEELSSNKSFLNTEALITDKISSDDFQENVISLHGNESIILATDALSRLIFNHPEVVPELLSIISFDGLNEFCLKYWGTKQLEEDDITAVIISLDGVTDLLRIIPGDDFEFPQPQEYEFKPTNIEPITKQFSTMQMQEIYNQFNGVARDMNVVKSRLKSNSMLLVTCIVLLAVNILTVIYLLKYNTRLIKPTYIRPSTDSNEVKAFRKKPTVSEAPSTKLYKEDRGVKPIDTRRNEAAAKQEIKED